MELIIATLEGAFVVVICIIIILCNKSKKKMARKMEVKFRDEILKQKERYGAVIMSSLE